MNETRRVDRADLPNGAGETSALAARSLGAALYALAFLSGAAALTYELAWTKLLSLTFGSTTLAASAVVGGFLGGMGIGAWLYDRLPGRGASPLRTYAAIEIGIALAAATLTLVLPHLPSMFAGAFHNLPAGPVLTGFRIASVLLFLLLPAALMGATYPALCTCLIRTRRGVDRHLGMLYGLNTLGAALGALVAGLALIPWLGLRSSVAIGVCVNLGIGVTAIALARRPLGRAATEPPQGPMSIPTLLPYWLTGSVILFSGFATLSYEILWFRALRYLVGNSTFALTIILVVFLLGLGLGALPLRRVAARGRPELDLARCQLGIALLAAVAIGATTLLASREELLGTISIFSPSFRALHWTLRLLAHAGIALALMLPATLLMGLSFPLASRLFLGDVRLLGRRVGSAYLLSNLGSIAGAILAATWLLPALGTVGGTRWVMGINVLLACAILARVKMPLRQRLAPAVASLVLLALLVRAFPDRLVFYGPHALPGVELVFEEEHDLGTVQVLQDVTTPERKVISIDGTFIGASAGWQRALYSKQLLIAHLPLVLDARATSALQIGLGSASTLEAMAGNRLLRRIDCVEINPGVIRGSLLFEESAVFGNRRVRVLQEDAIHFLVRRDATYDVIVSDGKQNPDFSGNSKLLSREFYELARSNLGEDGIFTQWISLGLLGSDFRTVLRTIANVFPELMVFFEPPGAVILVASTAPIEGRARMGDRAFRTSRAAKDLARIEIAGEADLLRRWVADRAAIVEASGPGPINTWDHAPLEFTPYRAGVGERQAGSAENLRVLVRAQELARSRAPAFARVDLPEGRAMAIMRRAYLRYTEGHPEAAQRLVRAALAENPGDPLAHRAARALAERGVGTAGDPAAAAR